MKKMIGYLKGKVKFKVPGWIIVEVNNIGYKVFGNFAGSLPEEIELFIHEHIREEAHDLYGFATAEEMGFFEQLISVSGVGPKMGLAILTIGSPERIKEAIIKGDTTVFKSVSGVGQKVAAKIIVELKNKVAKGGSFLPVENSENEDLVGAMEGLGYKQAEILNILKDLPTDLIGTQAKVTWALKRMKK
jgi:Holliday junction DNA helicase RuvA